MNVKPLQSVRCPKCLRQEVLLATAKRPTDDNRYSYGKCGRCGWYGRLIDAPKI